jgi:hypothetical protein
VAFGSGQDAALWNAVTSVMPERFRPCLPRSTGERAAASPPQVALVIELTTAIWSRTRATIRSYEASTTCLSLVKMPSRIHSSRRLRIVVAEQVVSVIARQEQTEAQELQHFGRRRSGR